MSAHKYKNKVFVKLSDDLISKATDLAKKTIATADSMGARDFTIPKDRLDAHKTGFIGELVVAGYLGKKHLNAEFVTRKDSDVGDNIEVRATRNKNGNIMLNERDAVTKRYVLVKIFEERMFAEIVGWEYGQNIKTEINRFDRPQFKEKMYRMMANNLKHIETIGD